MKFYLNSTLLIDSLELESLGLLPGEDVTPEVSVGGGLLEDWVLQLQVLQTEVCFVSIFDEKTKSLP